MKTGNFKKFQMFIRMLSMSLSMQSETVFVDLLTYADLELLKARKMGRPLSPQEQASMLKQNNKRYVIITYVAEFDKSVFLIVSLSIYSFGYAESTTRYHSGSIPIPILSISALPSLDFDRSSIALETRSKTLICEPNSRDTPKRIGDYVLFVLNIILVSPSTKNT